MSTELIKVEEFTSLMKSAPDALGKNQKSIANCNSAGQAILDTIQGEGMTDELDAKAAEYLKKVNVTITNMKSRRAPVNYLTVSGPFSRQMKKLLTQKTNQQFRAK